MVQAAKEQEKKKLSCLECFEFYPKDVFHFCLSCQNDMWICANCLLKHHRTHETMQVQDFQRSVNNFQIGLNPFSVEVSVHLDAALKNVAEISTLIQGHKQAIARAVEKTRRRLENRPISSIPPTQLAQYEVELKEILPNSSKMFHQYEC